MRLVDFHGGFPMVDRVAHAAATGDRTSSVNSVLENGKQIGPSCGALAVFCALRMHAAGEQWTDVDLKHCAI